MVGTPGNMKGDQRFGVLTPETLGVGQTCIGILVSTPFPTGDQIS